MSKHEPEAKAAGLPYARKLLKPITVLTEKVSSVTIREPNGADLSACGSPASIGPDGLTIDGKRMGALIARLAGVPTTAVDEMDGRDVYAIALRVADFLLSGVEMPS